MLRRALQGADRKMSPAILEPEIERESIAWLPGDERAGRGTGRASRPAFARLDAWSSIGWSQSEVDFVGRLAFERGVRSMLVIPGEEKEERGDFPGEAHSAQGYQDPANAFVL